MVFVYKKLAQFAVRCTLPPRRSESPGLRNRQWTLLHVASAGLVYWVARFFLLGMKARILGLTIALLLHVRELLPVSSEASVFSISQDKGKIHESLVCLVLIYFIPTSYLYQYCLFVCLFLVTKLYPTLRDPMDCSLPGSFVHGIFHAKLLAWVAISSSRGFIWP